MAGRKKKKERPENLKLRKTVSLITLVFVLIVFLLIGYFVGLRLVRQFREEPETFRAYVKSHGLLGQLTMIGIMMLQVVVAIIPGEPFEVGAGFTFGWFEGALLCLAGTAAASALIYLAVKKWGTALVELFFPRKQIKQYAFLRNKKKLDVLVFILFLIPGTPKDLLVYLIGLTPMKLGTFLLLSTLARIPSVVSSSVTGSLLHNDHMLAAAITYGVTLLISAGLIIWYRRMPIENQQPGDRP